MARQFGKWFAQGIEHFEGSRKGGIILKAEQDSGGVWTGPNGMITNPDGTPVYEGQTWTEPEAVAVYANGKQDFAEHVEMVLRGHRDLQGNYPDDANAKITQIMFDGLGLLCWNIGKSAFARSTVVKEIHAGSFEDAAAAFLMWKGDTMHGGNLGPDKKPVRGPDGQTLPKGVAWFKLFSGLYRRSMYGALLFMKRRPDFAADSNNVRLGKLTTQRGADYYYDVMVPEQSTSWRDALDASPVVIEEAPKPAPKPSSVPALPADWHLYSDSEKVAWLNTGQLRDLQLKGGDPVSPQVEPVKKVRPVKQVRPASEVPYLSDEAKADIKTKKVSQSKRGNAFANKKIAGTVGTVSIAGMAADQIGAVEPVLKAANTYGNATIGYVLLAGLGLAVIYWIWGEYLQRWGEEDADTLLE